MSERRRYVSPPVGRTTGGRVEPVRQATGSAPAQGSSAPNAPAVSQDYAQVAVAEQESQSAPVKRRRRNSGGGKRWGALRKLFLIAWAGLTVLLIAGLVIVWRQSKPGALAVDTDKYQAVFLTSGQVYFGKLHAYNSESIKLTDVYYLQTQAGNESDAENPQQAAADGVNVQLIKLGNEIHGPQDEMVVYKSQVLFYENLKSDSQVARSIDQHKNK